MRWVIFPYHSQRNGDWTQQNRKSLQFSEKKFPNPLISPSLPSLSVSSSSNENISHIDRTLEFKWRSFEFCSKPVTYVLTCSKCSPHFGYYIGEQNNTHLARQWTKVRMKYPIAHGWTNYIDNDWKGNYNPSMLLVSLISLQSVTCWH